MRLDNLSYDSDSLEIEIPKLKAFDLDSTKINMLLKELKKVREIDPKAKVVVFSQWTSFFELAVPKLKKNGNR